jgi:hypothetical protein
VKRQ